MAGRDPAGHRAPAGLRSRALRAVGLTMLLLAGAVVALAVVVPRIAGATPYTVLTGSMSPDLGVGTLVVVRPVDAEDVRIGTVVTYQLRSGQPEVVTHRVIGTRQGEDGREFLTQGDANPVPDAEPVREQQLRGELWYSLPWLGRVSHALAPAQREVLTTLLAGLLVTYAGGSFVAALVQRRRGRRDTPGRPTTVVPAPVEAPA